MAEFASIEKFIESLNKRIEDFEDAIEIAANTTGAKVVTRIFDKGKDINNSGFRYSALSKKIRGEKGLQTSFVDFKFTGNLQSEIRSSDNNPILNKTNENTWQLSVYRSDNIEKLNDFQNEFDGKFKDVFKISQEERDCFVEIAKNEILFKLNG